MVVPSQPADEMFGTLSVRLKLEVIEFWKVTLYWFCPVPPAGVSLSSIAGKAMLAVKLTPTMLVVEFGIQLLKSALTKFKS